MGPETSDISLGARDAAVRLAEQLVSQMNPDDLSLGYSLLDAVLPELQLDKFAALLPAELDVGQNLSLRSKWKQGREIAKLVVCNSSPDVRASIEVASESGIPQLVTALLTLLNGTTSPTTLITFAAALAATIIVRGFKDFCQEG
jgi:hypothetical protein